MERLRKNPRVLIVTPEVTYLPEGMGNMANYLTAKAGGLAAHRIPVLVGEL